MELDDALRARLGKLARSEGEGLDAAARRRVVARARATREEARNRSWLVPVFAAAALAIAAVLFDGVRGDAPAPVEPAEPAPIEAAEPLAIVPPGPALPPCAGEQRPEPRERSARGEHAIELGERALFVLSRNGAGTLAEVASCRTVFALSEGSVTVHARDLAGGELIVRARDADVVVHGTLFEVALRDASGDRVEVAVAEGTVGVSRGPERALLSAGDGVRLRGDTVRRFRMGRDRIAGMLERMGVPDVRRLPNRPRAASIPIRGEVTEGVPEVHQPRVGSP